MDSGRRIGMQRHIGLSGAVGVGVGAIVGGGILALAGVAFATTGAGALAAFALNGLIAFITALTFAELSSRFPESGGTYVFAKKVLSVRASFMVGWVVWFASIAAATLYAIGFGSFAAVILEHLWTAMRGSSSGWLLSQRTAVVLAITATALYTAGLLRWSGGSGQWINVAKVAVFAALILGGCWTLLGKPLSEIRMGLTLFLPEGGLGLIQAMGYTFIALQGFDLIAAVAGEIRDPSRTIPRAMIISLGIALAIYLPLLFLILTVGLKPGESIVAVSSANPETIVAIAAENYMGQFGYWLVMVAAVFSMLSALQANLFAASRIAFSMGRDRTLSYRLEDLDKKRGTPSAAILATALIISTILLVIPNVAAAGAASSLVFLTTFALAHGIGILARCRGGDVEVKFRVPCFPVLPTIGLIACLSLAIFQSFAVISAGLIVLVWLGFGGILYLLFFSRRAQAMDAAAEAFDPRLLQLRGKNPLALVPIANPSSAEVLLGVAHALTPPGSGRVLMHSVISPPQQGASEEHSRQILSVQAVLRESLIASFNTGLEPEALTTVAGNPWQEIARVAEVYRCETLVLGFSQLSNHPAGRRLEEAMAAVNCDIVVVRALQGWRLSEVRRVLVPVGGAGGHDRLRARILGSLRRTGLDEVTYLRVMSPGTPGGLRVRAEQELARFAGEEVGEKFQVNVVCSANVVEEIRRQATSSDLIILGLKSLGRRQKVLGDVAVGVAELTTCGLVMIHRRV